MKKAICNYQIRENIRAILSLYVLIEVKSTSEQI